jgi:hypothetical protein
MINLLEYYGINTIDEFNQEILTNENCMTNLIELMEK